MSTLLAYIHRQLKYDCSDHIENGKEGIKMANKIKSLVHTKWMCKCHSIEGYMMLDHDHLLLSMSPKISISNFMGYLKEKSTLMIFDKHANLKYKFWKSRLLGRKILCDNSRIK